MDGGPPREFDLILSSRFLPWRRPPGSLATNNRRILLLVHTALLFVSKLLKEDDIRDFLIQYQLYVM